MISALGIWNIDHYDVVYISCKPLYLYHAGMDAVVTDYHGNVLGYFQFIEILAALKDVIKVLFMDCVGAERFKVLDKDLLESGW